MRFDFVTKQTVDDYAKDGGPRAVCHLCSFYQDPLRVLTFTKLKFTG